MPSDGWIEYLGANQPVSPSFDRRQVYTENLHARITAGQKTAFTLDKLNLTSVGSPRNTSVRATLRPATGPGKVRQLGDLPVTDGKAGIAFRIAAPVRPGTSSGWSRSRAGPRSRCPSDRQGLVRIRTHGNVKTRRLRDGKIVVRFAPYATPGPKTVAYLGNDTFKRVRDTVTVRVRR